MILGISIINNFGKCRFMKLYQKHMVRGAHCVRTAFTPAHWPIVRARLPLQPEQQQQIMVKELFQTLNTRPDGVCNFLDASKWFDPGARIVYRQYATLFFIFAIDASESELGILDLIQVRASGPPPLPPRAFAAVPRRCGRRRPVSRGLRRPGGVRCGRRCSSRRSTATLRTSASWTSSSTSSRCGGGRGAGGGWGCLQPLPELPRRRADARRCTGWSMRWSWAAWCPVRHPNQWPRRSALAPFPAPLRGPPPLPPQRLRTRAHGLCCQVAETNMNDILDAVESQARLARQEGVGNGGPPGPNQPPSF